MVGYFGSDRSPDQTELVHPPKRKGNDLFDHRPVNRRGLKTPYVFLKVEVQLKDAKRLSGPSVSRCLQCNVKQTLAVMATIHESPHNAASTR